MPAFLLEIGLEEIPASMVPAAQVELAKRFRELVVRERLATDSLEVKSFSTPRRLAVLAEGLLPKQADMEEQVVGPSVAVAFKNGAPTPAAMAFAKKSGVDVGELGTIQNAKGEYVAATVRRAGRSAAVVLTALLPTEIAGISWPKNMYWRAGKPERFVRPVRWLLALLDEEILPLEFAGVTAAGVSYGHRVLHGDKPVIVRKPQEYAAKLAAAYVEVDPEARRQRIRKALDAETRKIAGARWREDEELVEVVTHLTEWPGVILGSFEPSYLDLPGEVLVTVMRDHQKYFALEDGNGKLLPNFLAVLNIEVDAAGAVIIRHGNERVLRARFNDARFFWDVDQNTSLVDRVEMLKNVTFQKDLGSYWDKTQANIRVVNDLAKTMKRVVKAGIEVDANVLKMAALLAKTDLTTELVKEFTELQGVIGGLYAHAQGLGAGIEQAIYWQYNPGSAEDAIPPTVEGQIFGLADRINTISMMFNIGLVPTGSKDPFALRRAGNGIVKILADSRLPISISDLISTSPDERSAEWRKIFEQCKQFLNERIQFYLQETLGCGYDSVLAAMAAGADYVDDVAVRTQAIEGKRHSEDFLAICAAFKRMKNILLQSSQEHEVPSAEIDPNLLREEAEQILFADFVAIAEQVKELRQHRRYSIALDKIASLRPSVDAFFDRVMVRTSEADLRANRLALLQRVLFEFSRIADFSQIVTE